MSDNTTPAAARPAKAAYTIAEFCSSYGLSPATVYRMLERGEIRAVKANGRTLVLRKDAVAWHNSLPTWQPSAGGQFETINGRTRRVSRRGRRLVDPVLSASLTTAA
jgi:excisionase family DNA binding protein